MELCSGCGAVAIPRERVCDVCGAAEGRARAPEPGEIYAVGVRCGFQCRSCGHRSPLDALDVDGTVRCGRCGLDQAFPVKSWVDALEFAHAVGDLAGPDPEGRFPDPVWSIAGVNPHRELGVSDAVTSHRQSGEMEHDGLALPRTLHMKVHIGHPLCPRCTVPLRFRPIKGGVETSCPRCNDTATWRLAEGARGLSRGLVAALDGDSREGCPDAKVERDQAVEGYRCPGCGAPLEPGGVAVVQCGYCHLACRLPPRAKSINAEAPPARWWLLFRGPSDARRRLLSGRFEASAARTVEKAPERTPGPAAKWIERGVALVWTAVALGLSGGALLAGLVATGRLSLP